jgi:hypothetical protein
MKNYFTLIASLLFSYASFAQTDIPFTPSGGPMGQGSWLRFLSGGSTSIQENWGLNINGSTDQPVKISNASLLVGYPSGGADFGVGHAFVNGKMGIGTTNPQSRFEVMPPDGSTAAGVFHLSGTQSWGSVLTLVTDDPNNDEPRLLFSYRNKAKQWAIGGYHKNNGNRFTIWEDAGDGVFGSGWGTERLTILPGGNIGIGTTDTHGFKLAVNGNIRAQEIKVEAGPWPDYVFKPTYLLPSLESIKSYIEKNQHLPDMPSETEVTKNGLNLGEMNKLLLKKVEELTLHMIRQQGEIDKLKKRKIGKH